ncbi:MAG: gluconate 2-dehydrogenase subunit 3 family protein [Flavobacteriaceae bacterium]
MDRREVLKTMPFILGSAIAAPTLLQLLVSCKNETDKNPDTVFLSEGELFVVNHIADIILPKTQTVGALDVNVPQFIDKVLKEVLTKKEQEMFSKGQNLFHEKFKAVFKKNTSKGTKSDFLELVSVYFKVSEDKQKQIFKLLSQPEAQVENKDMYYIYKYLTSIRYYTLYGYYTSGRVGLDILNYNPVPGTYEACIPVSEVGNSSSI